MNKIMNKSLIVACFLFIFFIMSAGISQAEISATIIANPDTGVAPLQVAFQVNSSENIIAYAWDFDNDGVVDSVESAPTHNYDLDGTFEAKVNITTESSSALLSKSITITSAPIIPPIPPSIPVSVSVMANPSSGTAPLAVQFTAAATGEEPLTYAWDFDGNDEIDSTQQNPATTFEMAGDQDVILTVTDAEGKSVSKKITISVTIYDSKLNLSSYFPENFKKGEQEITFIISNEGKKTIRDINARLIGDGIKYISSTSLPVLNPGDQDSITVKANFINSGKLKANLRVLDKTFPITFSVTADVLVQYNKQELQQRLDQLKSKLQEQEKIYYEKKAEGYLVAEIFDSIKAAKAKLQDIQQQILTNKLADVSVSSDLLESSIGDITLNLQISKKQEQTFMSWLKDNALSITTIIAAMGALGGILVKLTVQAKKVKEHFQNDKNGENKNKKEDKKKTSEKKKKKEKTKNKSEKTSEKKEETKKEE